MDMPALEGMIGQGGMSDMSAFEELECSDMSQMLGEDSRVDVIGEFAMKHL